MSMSGNTQLMQELSDAIAAERPVVLATVIATRRSVPRHAGTKMLVYAGGATSGTIGGGEMESRVIAEALDTMRAHRPRVVEYSLLDPDLGDPGLCGGEVQIYLEPFMPAHTIFIIGSGHVGRAVADLAHWLGFSTVVTDDRPDQLAEDVLPVADERIAAPVTEALIEHPITDDTSVLLVSRSLEIDVEALPLVLDSPARYIGVMGSKRRWKNTRAALLEAGVPEDRLARVHAPIGIEIGAETVEEIAVSVLAEVIRVLRSEDG